MSLLIILAHIIFKGAHIDLALSVLPNVITPLESMHTGWVPIA